MGRCLFLNLYKSSKLHCSTLSVRYMNAINVYSSSLKKHNLVTDCHEQVLCKTELKELYGKKFKIKLPCDLYDHRETHLLCIIISAGERAHYFTPKSEPYNNNIILYMHIKYLYYYNNNTLRHYEDKLGRRRFRV